MKYVMEACYIFAPSKASSRRKEQTWVEGLLSFWGKRQWKIEVPSVPFYKRLNTVSLAIGLLYEEWVQFSQTVKSIKWYQYEFSYQSLFEAN